VHDFKYITLINGDMLVVNDAINSADMVVCTIDTGISSHILYLKNKEIHNVAVYVPKKDDEIYGNFSWKEGVVIFMGNKYVDCLVAENPKNSERVLFLIEDEEENILFSSWKHLVEYFIRE